MFEKTKANTDKNSLVVKLNNLIFSNIHYFNLFLAKSFSWNVHHNNHISGIDIIKQLKFV